MKLHSFQIPIHAEKTRLLPLVKRMLPDVPEYLLREAFQKRDVKVNGERVGLDATVVPGAEVKIYTRDIQPRQPLLKIFYEDDNILVVFKPAGISCEEDSKGGRTLTQALLVQKPELGQEPLLCHRLDNPTEGLIVLARTERVKQLLQEAFRRHQVSKEYICLVHGTPAKPHALLEHYLVKDARHACVRVTPHPVRDAKEIVTEYTVIEKGECARLNIRLHTGRTHQIRAHMAFVGHPVLGDDQYGDRSVNKQYKARRLMLCSVKLRFQLEGELAYLNNRTFEAKPTF